MMMVNVLRVRWDSVMHNDEECAGKRRRVRVSEEHGGKLACFRDGVTRADNRRGNYSAVQRGAAVERVREGLNVTL